MRFDLAVEMDTLVHLVFQCVLPRLSHIRSAPVRVLARSGAAAGLLVGFPLLGAPLAASVSVKPASGDCPLDRAATYLNDPDIYGDRSQIILVTLNFASELLYRTKHQTIASASHRNSAGILDAHRTMATTDEKEALAIIRRRGVDLILLCPSAGERVFFTPPDQASSEGAVYRRLLSGDVPRWVREVELPPDLEGTFRLFEITYSTSDK